MLSVARFSAPRTVAHGTRARSASSGKVTNGTAGPRVAGFGVSRRGVLEQATGGFLAAGLLGVAPWSGTAYAAGTTDQAAEVLKDPKWPDEWPFDAAAFGRYDESKDTMFYDQPRFVTHIDDGAIGAITKFYSKELPKGEGVAVLDMCSSWISHYPEGYSADMVVGMGMNEPELVKNSVLTEYKVKDLNEDPTIPYPDNTFDAITNVVSVDYLTQPLKIFQEMHRVLKPGGKAIMSFSNRCFPTKAIAIWTQTGDLDHVWIVGSYFHYSVPDGFNEPQGFDISPPPTSPNPFRPKGDPMYVVMATKKEA